MNPSHTSQCTRHQAVAALVEVEELALLLHEGEVAVEVVAPAVVLAGELPADAAGLLLREVVPHQLVAAVPADVVERLDLAVGGAHHDDRRVGDLQLLGEVAALARKLLDAADVQPRALEDRLALELVELGGDRVLVGHRLGAELRIVLGPAAFGRLREIEPSLSCRLMRACAAGAVQGRRYMLQPTITSS